jgi:hypothetical protein
MRDPRLMTAAEREAALAEYEQAKGPSYTPPVPPPAELGFDIDKWNRMPRAERRAVLRFAKKRRK